MTHQDLKDLELWRRELERGQFQNNGMGSHSRHTDSAFDADFKVRLLGSMIQRLVQAEAERRELDNFRGVTRHET